MVAAAEKSRRIAKGTKHASRLVRCLRLHNACGVETSFSSASSVLNSYSYIYRAGSLAEGEMDSTCNSGALCRRLAADWPGDDLCA